VKEYGLKMNMDKLVTDDSKEPAHKHQHKSWHNSWTNLSWKWNSQTRKLIDLWKIQKLFWLYQIITGSTR
jgi:hypothetical protein